MAINADGYLNHLKSYLDLEETRGSRKHYGFLCKAEERKGISDNEIILADDDDTSKERLKVKLGYSGKMVGIKLDACQDKLFHFLQNDGHPWSKRCDFVIFHAYQDKLRAYCIEFKKARTYIPIVDVALQLNAAEAWCCTLHSLIANYVGKETPIAISKFVFTDCQNPTPDLERTGKYLKKHPDIRHYLFSDLVGLSLENLENTCERRVA